MDNFEDSISRFSANIIEQESHNSLDLLTPNSIMNIKVYQNNFLYNHLDQLSTVFKCTKKILGENNFKYFCRMFLLSSPPKHSDMNQYGEGLSIFLGNREELSSIGYLVHIAKLDWFWFEQSQDQISLPKGIFKLWNTILDGEDTSGIEINEFEIENIFYK